MKSNKLSAILGGTESLQLFEELFEKLHFNVVKNKKKNTLLLMNTFKKQFNEIFPIPLYLLGFHYLFSKTYSWIAYNFTDLYQIRAQMQV